MPKGFVPHCFVFFGLPGLPPGLDSIVVSIARSQGHLYSQRRQQTARAPFKYLCKKGLSDWIRFSKSKGLNAYFHPHLALHILCPAIISKLPSWKLWFISASFSFYWLKLSKYTSIHWCATTSWVTGHIEAPTLGIYRCYFTPVTLEVWQSSDHLYAALLNLLTDIKFSFVLAFNNLI